MPASMLLKDPRRWVLLAVSLGVILGTAALLDNGQGAVEGSAVLGRWPALLPPVFAVAAALIFHQVYFALGGAVLLGAFLAFGPNPYSALVFGFHKFGWEKVTDPFNLYIMGFVSVLFGLIHLMARSGGMGGVLEVLRRYATSARSTRVATGLMGLALFFDDYSNSLLIGTIMRKVTDQYRVSREKLAYLVDSTAAPVAGLALISTWIAYEVGLFAQQATDLGLEMSGYAIFVQIVPYRFYCWVTLAFLLSGAALARDFGPMLTAERRAMSTGQTAPEGTPELPAHLAEALHPPEGAPRRAVNALLPVGVLLGMALAGMLSSGSGAVREAGLSFDLLSGEVWRVALGAANSAQVLFWSAVVASLLAVAMASAQRILTPQQAGRAFVAGLPTTVTAIGILLLAWAMKDVSSTLGTDKYLLAQIGSSFPAWLLPLVVFLTASAIAFATGTSWGTMGILLPVAMPLAANLTMSNGQPTLILWLTAGAVLDGAIFGDHCSPLSDTTVLSSLASGCNHTAHVRTQAPYALVCMVIAGAGGYLLAAQGLGLWAIYPLLIGLILAVWLLIGTKVEG